MSNIIDSIQLSGVTYGIKGSGGTETIELTQAQYDALVDKDPNVFYIITDAQAGDLTNYYTKTETNTLLGGKADTATTYTKTEVDTALGGKQATLISGTNIKTINNESILGSGNIDIQGGGGKAIEAGRGISITTGETADTVSFSLPISANTNNSVVMGGKISSSFTNNGRDCLMVGSNLTTNNGSDCSLVVGYNSSINGDGSAVIGWSSKSVGDSSFAFGTNVSANTSHTFAAGYVTIANNNYEASFGKYNASNTGSTNANKTLFSVGNGTADNARHNAFEIRQNGDIYITLNDQDVKLQDQLGGGGGTVESAITSGSTNAVESKAIWSATTFNKGVLLTFNGNRQSTNYPEGCGKLVVGNISRFGGGDINFKNDEYRRLGRIDINNWGGGIDVNINFDGASYEISGTTVIINYPSTDISFVEVGNTDLTYTAVVEGAWVSENTYMNVEVDAIASGLQNNINAKLDATAYTPTVVDSALNVASTNPVQNQALYSELRIDNGETETTLAFENGQSTNYPNGCTKLNVEVVGSDNFTGIRFLNNNGQSLGNIDINSWGGRIDVNINFDGASYEISGTTVIITYPTVTSVTKIRTDDNANYVFKAIVASATSLKDQVTANTTALGGLSLVKLTQAQYDALATKDNSTLYVIVN